MNQLMLSQVQAYRTFGIQPLSAAECEFIHGGGDNTATIVVQSPGPLYLPPRPPAPPPPPIVYIPCDNA